MGTPLSVLIVEDSASDASLAVRHLHASGFDVESERVEAAEQMRAALDSRSWDLILCDFSLPGFDATGALKVLRDSGLDIPLIIVSGVVGEETAVELLRGGARDYVMKDNMPRLGPAVRRELAEARARAELRRAEKSLRASEAKYRILVETIPAVTFTAALDATYSTVYISPQIEAMLGFTPDEWLADPALWSKQLHPDDRERTLRELQPRGNHRARVEFRIFHKDGHLLWAAGEAVYLPGEDGKPAYLHGLMLDITEHKLAEEEIRNHAREMEQARNELVAVLEKQRAAEALLRTRTDELIAQNLTLQRFNRATIDRELRMIAMKREINALLQRLGEPARYRIVAPPADDIAVSPPGAGVRPRP